MTNEDDQLRAVAERILMIALKHKSPATYEERLAAVMMELRHFQAVPSPAPLDTHIAPAKVFIGGSRGGGKSRLLGLDRTSED